MNDQLKVFRDAGAAGGNKKWDRVARGLSPDPRIPTLCPKCKAECESVRAARRHCRGVTRDRRGL